MVLEKDSLVRIPPLYFRKLSSLLGIAMLKLMLLFSMHRRHLTLYGTRAFCFVLSDVPRYLLELPRNWYSHSSCSVLWNGTSSRKVSIRQGVRQGGILSPFLYSVFVDELLDLLVSSRYGDCIGMFMLVHPCLLMT